MRQKISVVLVDAVVLVSSLQQGLALFKVVWLTLVDVKGELCLCLLE